MLFRKCTYICTSLSAFLSFRMVIPYMHYTEREITAKFSVSRSLFCVDSHVQNKTMSVAST